MKHAIYIYGPFTLCICKYVHRKNQKANYEIDNDYKRVVRIVYLEFGMTTKKQLNDARRNHFIT